MLLLGSYVTAAAGAGVTAFACGLWLQGLVAIGLGFWVTKGSASRTVVEFGVLLALVLFTILCCSTTANE